MTKEQRERLKALLAMDASKLSDDDKKELATLQGLAAANPEDGKALTDEEVSGLVQKALDKVLKDNGLSTDSIVEKVKSLGLKAEGLTAEKIEEIVKANAGDKLDAKALVAEITKAMPQGISEAKVKELLDEAVKSIRKESKMEHSIEIPIAHRSGNLTVAQKQLLNICLMHSGAESESKPKSMNDGITEAQLAKAARNGEVAVKSVRDSVRYGAKLTAGGDGTGLQLVDTDLSSDLQRRLYMESRLAAAMIANEIQMPTNPFQLPMTTTRPDFFVTGETQAAIGSDVGTAAPTLNAKKLTGMVPYSYEADEDSIVAILPMLQESLGAGAADAFEGALLNGDTTATHQDSDIHAVTRHSAKLLIGLRKLCRVGTLGSNGVSATLASGGLLPTLVTNTNVSNGAANIKALQKAMKRYGMKVSDLLLICGTDSFNDISMLPECLTQDKIGNRATVTTGFQPNIFGIEIVPSAACREDMNASAVYDGTTTSKRALFLIHKPSFLVGTRRGFTVEVEVDKKAQVNYVIASFRRDFIPKETPSATQPLVVMGYNF